MEVLKAEIRAKLYLRIDPKWGEDDSYDKWVAEVESAVEGVMDVLNKYDVKERVDGTGQDSARAITGAESD